MEHNFDIVVQKYGGSSLAEPQKITRVAGYIKNRLQKDLRLCIVVSAMGDTTNQLISLANLVHPDPPKRELDMLISCGERSSMALLAMALCHQGVKALSLTGSQSGIITDECHSGAELIAVRPQRVLEAFNNHDVVIIAGFQGISRTREITTLRRGGSDTTAVAMAAALKAQVCEIYSDVAGVMTLDPRISDLAELIPEISHENAGAYSLYGAKILAHDAAKLAQDLGVQLLVAQTGESKNATLVHEVVIKKANTNFISCITHLRGIIRLELLKSELQNFKAGYFLCGAWHNNLLVGYASNDIAQELPTLGASQIQAGLALITIHVSHQKNILGALTRLLEIFKNNNLEILDIITGSEQIFIVMNDEMLNLALSLVHDSLVKQWGQHDPS